MTDYSQNTTFADKDALTPGDPGKVIKGSDVDAELSEIESAIMTKIDKPSSPSTYDFLRYSGSAWVAATGGWVKLSSTDASDDATIDIESGITSTFSLYVIRCYAVVPATDGAALYIRLKTGGSYQSTSYIYHTTTVANGADAYVGVSSGGTGITTAIDLGAVGSGSGESFNGLVYMTGPAGATPITAVWADGMRIGSAGGLASVRTVGQYNSTGVTTGIRFLFSSGNVASGTFALYGIA